MQTNIYFLNDKMFGLDIGEENYLLDGEWECVVAADWQPKSYRTITLQYNKSLSFSGSWLRKKNIYI